MTVVTQKMTSRLSFLVGQCHELLVGNNSWILMQKRFAAGVLVAALPYGAMERIR